MEAEPRYRIVMVDDHPLFRGALRQALQGLPTRIEVEEAGSVEEGAALLDRGDGADLVLLDLLMPGVEGPSGLAVLRARHPHVPIVVVSASQDERLIRRCFDLGASGFIPKSLQAEDIRAAVVAVLGGEIWVPPGFSLEGTRDETSAVLLERLSTLTPKQLRVLSMLSRGLLNKQIAHEIGVTEATVKAHITGILNKLGVESRTQAVIATAQVDLSAWRGRASPSSQG